MQRLTLPTKINLTKPVMEFYEDGDWLRIESPGRPTRYIPKNIAQQILFEFGKHSFTEKPYIITR